MRQAVVVQPVFLVAHAADTRCGSELCRVMQIHLKILPDLATFHFAPNHFFLHIKD